MVDADTRELNELLKRTEQLRSAVLALVVTYGSISPHDDSSYRARREWIDDECHRLGIEHPFEWENARELLAWGRQLGGYNTRRKHVAERIDGFIETLTRLRDHGRVDDWGDTLDEWTDLDNRVKALREELDGSVHLDDYQDVGRRAREVVNDAINLVYSDEIAAAASAPPSLKPKERLELVLKWYMPGRSHERFRSAMNAALSLAHHVTHSSSTSRVEAFAAAQSAVLVVRTLAEMRRMGPQGSSA